MAKISSYPILSNPTVNDILIGTDVENSNITKNFSIGSIVGLVGDEFVPYTGATGNVNLGAFNITSSSFIVAGGTASQFLKANGTLDSTVYVPATRTLTINGTTYNLSANRSWDLNTVDSLTTVGTSGAATYISKVLNIPIYQAQGNYITQLSGEATAVGPGNATVTLSNSAVISKILTGLNITGGTVVDTDSILTAFGKVQNQINGLAGGVEYQGTWNASTNVPFLQSSVGVQGYYYVVSVAGNTNLNGITDWQLGDWAIFNGSVWQKVDNTDAVVSVNGYTGAVVLTAADVGAVPTGRILTINGVGYNLTADRSWTVGDVRTDQTYTNPSFIASLAWSKITGTPTTLAGYGITDGALKATTITINGVTFDLSANRTYNVGTVTSVGTSGPLTGGTITGSGTIGITQAGTSTDGYLSSTDWNTFNNKQNALTNPVTGTGTINTLPMWGGATSLVNSPLSYGTDAFNFQYNSATGGTVNFTNIGLTTYTYSIQMNNFGSPRSTFHSYTDGIVVQSIGGTQVSRVFANGNFILGTGVVDNGYKLEITGNLYVNSIVNATTDTDRFIVSDGGVIKYRTGAELLSDIGGQGALTLTTTGSSGSSTFISNVLNVPTYTLSGLGGVPTSRTITINGTTQDLSADRTYSVGTVTSVAALTLGTSGTDLSSSVANGTTTPVITLNVPTASATNRGALSAADWSTFNSKQNTITLTTTGTSGAATLIGATLNIPQYQAAGTYVTSVTASSPLFSSGGITPNITIQQASGSQSGFLSSTDWNTFNNKQNVLTNPVTGTGSAGQVSYWSSSSVITGESNLFWDATNDRLGIGTNTPSQSLHISGPSTTSMQIQAGGGAFSYIQLSTPASDSGYLIKNIATGNGALDKSLYLFNAVGPIQFVPSGTMANAVTVTTGGNLLVGTTTDNGAKLQVNGDTHIINSDARLRGGDVTGRLVVGNSATSTYQIFYGSSHASVPNVITFVTNSALALTLAANQAATFSSSVQGSGFFSVGSLNNTNGSFYIDHPGTQTWKIGITNANTSTFSIGNDNGGAFATKVLNITNAGNVGIGTASPSAKLNVSGDIHIGDYGTAALRLLDLRSSNSILSIQTDGTSGGLGTNIIYSWANGGQGPLRFSNASSEVMRLAGNGNVLIGTLTSAASVFKLQVGDGGSDTRVYLNPSNAFALGISNSGSNAYYLGVASSGSTSNMQIFNASASTTPLTITYGGNVLIGGTSSTNSVAALQVFGSTAVSTNNGQIRINDSATTSKTLSIGVDGANNVAFLQSFQDGVAYRSLILNGLGGNVGIGTASPDANLDVVRGSTGTVATFGIEGLTINPRLRIDADEANNTITLNPNYSGGVSSALVFKTAEVERMRITSGGNVGIGTSNPESSRLLVRGSTSDSTSNIFQASNLAGATRFMVRADGQSSFFASNDSESMRITTGGNVLIGTTTDAGYTLNLVGNAQIIKSSTSTAMVVGLSGVTGSIIRFSYNGGFVGSISTDGSNTAYNTSSDYRLKEQVRAIDNPLEKVLKLNPVNFKYKNSNTRQDGFIAHEIQEILPYLVTGEKDGVEMQEVDYSKLTPILIAAIKELKQEIDKLRK